MLFRCEDLERYVKETSQEKMNLILINKADFLSERQRKHWAEYFDSLNLPVAFFSALQENQNNQLRKMKILEEDEEVEEEEEEDEEDSYDEHRQSDGERDSEYDDLDPSSENERLKSTTDIPTKSETSKEAVEPVQVNKSENETVAVENCIPAVATDGQIRNTTRLLSRGELIEFFKTIHKGRRVQEGRAVIGLVGYPNVGKSSTINSLLTYKKVSVSATPGKTKHFQVCCNFNYHMTILL